jgi:cobalamin biosynthesis protein CobD/CbiB
MKIKTLLILLILSSFTGYLEWGKGNSAFLYQAEYEVLNKLFTDPRAAAHPFTLIPLLGQILLLISLVQKSPKRILIYTGTSCIGILLTLMFFIGILSLNFKIILSTLPFIVLAILTLRQLRKKERKDQLS